MLHRSKYFVIFTLFLCVNAQEKLDRLKCDSRIDCRSCLQEPGCVWCLRPELKNISPSHNSSSVLNHCIPEKSDDITCSENLLINPKTGGYIIDDHPLQNSKGSIIQLKPQKIHVALRSGESYNFTFQYSQAENYPVDLYYIIDNSFSMEAHKNKLATLGTKLAKTMSELTNDFRIGFGSFIDKVELPYVSTLPEKLEQPCTVVERRKSTCIPPYSFRNHLPLTKDFEKFAKEVRNAQVSGNLDSPEGGFDAIMQAIVCKREIGWRPKARHLIVFSTDATFHIAGDGKLAGIIETNDAKCHMKDNQYKGLDNDYPSVSQLNYVAKENNINLIFAVVKSASHVTRSYKSLAQNIENSQADSLDNDSNNVIKLVVDNYKKIVNSVTLETNATENIQVKIIPHCDYPTEDGCSKIRLGEVVNFTATIKLLKCAGESQGPTVISIKPDAIDESMLVELETVCRCPCESPGHPSYKKNARECASKGNLVCGTCMCNEDRHGSQCECDKRESQVRNETNCVEDKPGAKVCSGLGVCQCGKCECKTNPNSGKQYRGKFCDCDDDSCDKENGILCGGRGLCSCGFCNCNAGWTGSSCECPDNNRTCIADGIKEHCSGKGKCVCGKCECSDKHTGTYCEDCPTCMEKCVNIKDCVECTVFQTGIYDKNQCKLKCVTYDISTTNEPIVKMGEEDKICRTIDNKKCEIVYKYRYDDLEKLVITVQREKYCEPNLLVWALSVTGSILLIGLLTLLIWKIFTTFQDKREYTRFIKEQKSSKWHTNENPLFKDATTTFENPYYPH